MVKKATCLMTITQYNSYNSLTPEFKWALLKNNNYNLDELIRISTQSKEKSMIKTLFRTQDLKLETGTIPNQHQNSPLIHHPLCFQNPWICLISMYCKNPQSVPYLRPNLSICEPIFTPLFSKLICCSTVANFLNIEKWIT